MTPSAESPTSAMIVGGAGFLGSHLTDRLLSEGMHVDVVDDLSSGSLTNLASARSQSESGALHIHTLDAGLPQFSEVVRLRRPDIIYLLSALTPCTKDPQGAVRSFGIAVSVLEAARSGKVDKVVVTLPAGVLYGGLTARELPVKEDRERRPIGVAGVAAWAIVDLLEMYRRDHDIEFTVLAMPTVYGPRQVEDSNVVSAFLAAYRSGTEPEMSGDGRQTRDFLFVDDAVDAAARSSSKGGGLVLHIGTGVQTSVRDLWATIGGDRPVRTEPRPRHDQDRIALSSSRARLHLGWTSWTRLEDGLSQTQRSYLGT
jgi:UDP-glucose 4-epimerase